jgi:tetratricopeptide (TPR) repeat protein
MYFFLGPLRVKETSENKRRDHNNISIEEKPAIHTDLIIPKESVCLPRLSLMKEIDKALKTSQLIQTVALVGIGGSGKTTLARQYALRQNAEVIWEINAETSESLANSFENLAYALAETEKERKILKEIQDLKNLHEKKEKIILFVKIRLKNHSPWFLIYNNVEKFMDIQHYFPHLPSLWGEGKVLITTRNSHIQSNPQINHTIEVAALTLEEKIELFSKIMKEGGKIYSELSPQEEIIKFIEQLPSFPLDISMAAHYLLATNISYSQYLTHLKNYNADFYLLHQEVIKEVSDYSTTRHRIIITSVKDLMDIHPGFRDLLLLISVLNSQNIPKKLLDLNKNDILADNFIYHLKKYSFLIDKTTSPWKQGPSYSIHRSTQRIILSYLTKALDLENNYLYLKSIMETLEAYAIKTIDLHDLEEMKSLQSHLEKFLSHSQLLTPTVTGALQGQLASIYFKMGDYPTGKKLFEDSLINLSVDNIKNSKRIAPLMVTLSSLHWDLGEFETAKNHLEKAIQIYKTLLPEKKGELARAIGYLGVINSELENFSQAEELLQTALKLYQTYNPEHHNGMAQTLAYLGIAYGARGKYDEGVKALKQSLKIYKTYLPQKYISYAWTLKSLGNIYVRKGNYREALAAFEKSLNMHEKYLPENPAEIAIIYANIGNINRALGNYKLAKLLLERSLDICNKYIPHNYIVLAQVLGRLAHVFKELGNYKEAKAYHEKSIMVCSKSLSNHAIKIARAKMHLGGILAKLGNFTEAYKALQASHQVFEKNYGKSHIEVAQLSSYFGQFYLLKGNLEEAETHLLQALEKFKQHDHTDAYIVMEDLGQLYLEKSKNAEIKGNSLEAYNLKQHAINYLKEALEIVNNNLPDGNTISQKIRTKLKNST